MFIEEKAIYNQIEFIYKFLKENKVEVRYDEGLKYIDVIGKKGNKVCYVFIEKCTNYKKGLSLGRYIGVYINNGTVLEHKDLSLNLYNFLVGLDKTSYIDIDNKIDSVKRKYLALWVYDDYLFCFYKRWWKTRTIVLTRVLTATEQDVELLKPPYRNYFINLLRSKPRNIYEVEKDFPHLKVDETKEDKYIGLFAKDVYFSTTPTVCGITPAVNHFGKTVYIVKDY